MKSTTSPHRDLKRDLIKGATGDWEAVIGLEVHAQVASEAKLFSGASTAFGGAPNSHVSLVDAAMPGMLPVINEACIAQAVRTGLGLNAKINLVSVFDRKNYFYPDLPQGYQISQYKQPIVGAGEVEVDVDGETVTVGIERVHLEQDAGKLIHDQHAECSLVDLNRAGVALMEIVSKPDLRSSKQAQAYVTKLRSILRYLGTSDADMEKGNLRADLNVSVRRAGDTEYGTRCEIKNVNSIRTIGQAIDYEARRQVDILEDGGAIRQETRLFDSAKGVTRSMRSKEEAHDYRYFPDPDLLPLELTQDYVEGLRKGLPELPDEKRARFMAQYGLSAYDAGVLTAEKDVADFFEAAQQELDDHGIHAPTQVANWVINAVLGALNKENVTIKESKVSPAQLAVILKLQYEGTISSKIAKDVFEIVWNEGGDPAYIVEKRGLKQVTDIGDIEVSVNAVIAANPDKVAQAKAKPAAIGWFVGQVMKATGGKANPQAVNEILQRKLGSASIEKVKRPTRQDFSTLDRHRRQGKVFTPPLMTVTDNLQLHSWSNERLPEALWTALLANELSRPEYMRLLSTVAKAAMNFRDQPEVFPAHSALASISKKQFAGLFDEVLKNKIAARALAPLLLLDSLPDRAHWSAHLSKPQPDEGWNALARAIAASFHPRSPAAMDSRWLRVMFLGLQHRLLFRKEHEDVVEMLCAYPEGKDVPDWADAMISAMEPGVDIGPDGERLANWSEKFWNDCLKNTPCIRPRYTPPVQEPEFDYDGAKKRWGDIYAGLAKHFFETIRTTGTDARHDAVFGLALYAMSLVVGLMRPHSTRPSGRHLLRSLAEAHITLAYLALKDDPATWQTYRAYGIGQAKLAFLKLVEGEWDDLPRYVDLGVLEWLANEDMWQEFVPVDVGHWAGITVRRMAEDAGVKEIYDNYYVWPSGYVHGHWGAVRDSVFDLCANPLHRFHRIPRPMRVDMPDLCFDAIRVMNRTLALVEKTFPPFDLRFDENP